MKGLEYDVLITGRRRNVIRGRRPGQRAGSQCARRGGARRGGVRRDAAPRKKGIASSASQFYVELKNINLENVLLCQEQT